MKKIKIVLIGVLIFILLSGVTIIGFGANYLYNLALNPTTPKDLIFSSDDEATKDSVKQNETSGAVTIDDKTWLLEHSGYQDLYITSQDGLNLHNYVINRPDSNKWIITVHGYTSEGLSMASYAHGYTF